MRISASNIGWKKEDDEFMYKWMNSNKIEGLEIAPTRIFENNPYDQLKEAKDWARNLKEEWNLSISSMQSIWYGRKENIFASKEERNILTDYTKRAIDFAHAIDCPNLVFGCPRNRNIPEGANASIAEEFFNILGEYAYKAETVIAMEANPPMYNTNFINTTLQAIELVERVNNPGFRLNLDIGTMIANEETVNDLKGYVNLINHVHISEPGLNLVKRRDEHTQIKRLLETEQYNSFVSLEVKLQENQTNITEELDYLKRIFNDCD